jgi:RNA polymerase sigma-70 factor (ECF subfamily)
MIATATMVALPSAARPLAWLLSALSVLFGGDAEPLEEDAMQRLVEQARAGDRAARQRLYRQHVQRVFRTVRGMLRSDAEAEDVTQDAMLTALTSLDRYSPRSGTRFAAWLATIAVNTTRRRFRRRWPELTATGELPDVADAGADVADDLDFARQRAALVQALTELESREREIVSLRYGSDLNATEIAAQLGMEPANVRKILERARVRLGERIEALVKSRGAAA